MPPTASFNEVVQVVELVVPRCSLEFGVGLCTATTLLGPYCYKQWGGCLAKQAFNDDAVIKWRFMKKGPRAMELYETATDMIGTDPLYMLDNVSTEESRINIGSVRVGDAPLGITGSLNVNFTDEPFDDYVGDPYRLLRTGSNPEAGFWENFIARVPYVSHIQVNVYEGFWGDSLDLMSRRTYLMESISGPTSSGKVSITAVDPLRITDPKRASFPPEMDIQLNTTMTASTPSSISVQRGVTGDLEIVLGNTSTKYLLIGSEVIGYTGQTDDGDGFWTLTGVTRGQLGTTAASHAIDDACQRVGHFETMDSWEIAEFLFGFTRVPAAYVNTGGAWTTEASTYLQGYQFTRTIVRPTPVNKLLGELMRDSTFYLWWDAFSSEIKLRAIRPEDATAYIDDDRYVLGSFSIRREPKERMSRVHVRFGKRDPTKGADFTNYRQSVARIASDEEYEKAGAEVINQVIYSDWVITKAIADEITLRLLARFAKTPVYATLRIVGDGIENGEVVELRSPRIRDAEGFKVTKKWQVISAKAIKPKELTELTLQQFIFQSGRFMVWMEDAATPYTDVPVDDREDLIGVGYWTDDDGLMADGSVGWLWQ